jgi:DNA-binding NarL/FixJ family response regulator
MAKNFKYKILIIDDSKEFSFAFRELILEAANAVIERVDILNSPLLAVEKIIEEQYQYIFMDIQMPGINGIELTRTIDRMNSGAKIIAVSFHNEMDYITRMITAGARNYIVKEDISPELIRQILKVNILEKSGLYFN